MRYTISQVGRRFGISRSTLLYYDSIGLLSPKARSSSNYRVYTDRDLSVMEEIAKCRNAGIPIREVKKSLRVKASKRGEILRRRLNAINDEIKSLRQQQRFILSMLDDRVIACTTRVLTKEKWVAFLRKAGLDEAGMGRWHSEFEAASPEAHQDFLESLGISASEIHMIRQRSQKGVCRT